MYFLSAIKQLHTDMFNVDNGDRMDAPNIAIIVTDREGSLLTAVEEANIARNKGINMAVVGLGKQV